MVRLRASVAPERSFGVVVIFTLIITGLAFTCVAVCLSSLTVLSIALKVRDHHDAESRLLTAQLLLQSARRNCTTAGLASVPDGLQQGVQFISFESRFSSALPLLRNDFRNATIASPASVRNGLQQGIQLIRFDAPTLAPMAFTQFCLKYPSDCKSERLLFGGDRIELNSCAGRSSRTSIALSIHRSAPSEMKTASLVKNGCWARFAATATITP